MLPHELDMIKIKESFQKGINVFKYRQKMATSSLIKIPTINVKTFLENYYKKPVTILEYSEIGTGWVAVGYKVKFKIDDVIRQVAVRTLKPVDFSKDYPSDRAAYFWIQHESAKNLPDHVKSLGIIGISSDKKHIGLIQDYDEFFQILEWAQGDEYINDLEKILKQGTTEKNDFARVSILSRYLAEIHKLKCGCKENVVRSLYKRHSRDYVGSAFLMDVLDTYPRNIKFASWPEVYRFVNDIYI